MKMGCHGHDRMVVGFPITCPISAYHHSGRVYLMQYYVIKFVSALWQVSGFLHQYNWNIVESGVKHHKPNQDENTAKRSLKEDKVQYLELYLILCQCTIKMIQCTHLFNILHVFDFILTDFRRSQKRICEIL